MHYFDNQGMKYWDDFEKRASETLQALACGKLPPLRRLSVHIGNSCNFACEYCNEIHQIKYLSFDLWTHLLCDYSMMGGGIVHVTGGEPTVVPKFLDYIQEAQKYDNLSFHLNTNMFSRIITDDMWPIVKRLKVSLDTTDAKYFNDLVRRKLAYERVTENLDHVHQLIEDGKTNTIVSITFTVTRENYLHIPAFLEMYHKRWPKFYATFFSSYKGMNERFAFKLDDIERLFSEIVPQINRMTEEAGDTETRFLFHASHSPSTFVDDTRFPDNRVLPCHLQLSELVVDEDGEIHNCSHLFRDKVPGTGLNLKDGPLWELFEKAKRNVSAYPLSDKCLYGCNKKLVTFNQVVEKNKVS